MNITRHVELTFKTGILKITIDDEDESVYIYWGNRDGKLNLVDEVPYHQVYKALQQICTMVVEPEEEE